MDVADISRMSSQVLEAEQLSHSIDHDETVEETLKAEEESPYSIPPNVTAASASVLPILKQIIPHLTKHLNFEDVFQCRLVCHDICQEIDHQLENNFDISPTSKFPQSSVFINCRIHSSPNGPHILEAIHLLDSETIKSFLIKMENHTRNPFIGRCVRFGNYGDTTHNSEYWENVLELLRKFGQHIWHVELADGHVAVPDPLTCYKLLRQCLILLPNLKSLEISFAHETIGEDKLAILVKYMHENPTPSLKFLEKVDWNDHHVSQTLQDFIIASYSHQMKALAAPMSVFYVEISELTFPNLGTLYLTNVENNEYLVDLRWCKLPSLKNLYLNLGGERYTSSGDLCNETWNVKSLLLLVKQFQLKFLSLFLAPGSQLKGSRNLMEEEWELGCLMSLEVQHFKETSYEFLKCFTRLKHIHIFDIHHPLFPERNVDKNDDYRNSVRSASHLEEQVINTELLEIDKFVYTGKIYESIVWEVIPTLQVFTFKCVWDREGKKLIDVNDWYWRETYEQLKKSTSVGVVSKVVKFVKSMFSLA